MTVQRLTGRQRSAEIRAIRDRNGAALKGFVEAWAPCVKDEPALRSPMATDDDEAMADLGLATMNLAELRRVLDAIPAEVFGLPECQTANRFHRRMVSLLEARTLRLNARRAAAGADHVTFRDPTSTLAGTPKRHSDADGSGRGRRGSLP